MVDIGLGNGERDNDSADLETSDIELLDEADPEAAPVTYSGTDFDVEGLVRRFDRGDIVVPSFGHNDETIETAGFQRRFVWRRSQMDRFIESLLLEYPIPGIFFVQQQDKKYLILDGQQRIRTLVAFYAGVFGGREFALQNVADEFKNLTYKSLSSGQRRTLDNTFIQATIVKTDGSAKSMESVYQVFERLNSGGTQLTPHEIRVALYAGRFIEFLTNLNTDIHWRQIYGPMSPRLRDQELILRYLALYLDEKPYTRPLKRYLNDFVSVHRDLQDFDATKATERFSKVTELLSDGPGMAALRGKGRQVNAALAESIMVGLARRLDRLPEPSSEAVGRGVDALLSDGRLEDLISQATANEERVLSRVQLATNMLSEI